MIASMTEVPLKDTGQVSITIIYAVLYNVLMSHGFAVQHNSRID